MSDGPEPALSPALPRESARDLYDGAPFAYLSVDPDGLIVRANRTALAWTGYDRDGLVGRRNVRSLLTMGGRIYYDTHVSPLLRIQGAINEIALDVVRADGSAFPALLNGAEVRDPQGRVAGARITLVDATDRRRYEREILAARRRAEELSDTLREVNETLEERIRLEVERRLRAEEQLRQAEKMRALGQMAGGVAHDVNNLLGAILANVEVVRTLAGERAQPFLASAMRSVERGSALTQRLLAFSRGQVLNPGDVDVAALIGGLGDLLRSALPKACALEIAVPRGLPQARVDPHQLEVALMNLAVNAGHAMPAGGTFRLTALACRVPDEACDGEPPEGLEPGLYLRIEAADTGIGMDPATLARATEPFFTTKPFGQGTGLGLSMVHGFAEQSGGRLSLASRPGEGTRATIWLPAGGTGARSVPA